jgi:hypothetical protein
VESLTRRERRGVAPACTSRHNHILARKELRRNCPVEKDWAVFRIHSDGDQSHNTQGLRFCPIPIKSQTGSGSAIARPTFDRIWFRCDQYAMRVGPQKDGCSNSAQHFPASSRNSIGSVKPRWFPALGLVCAQVINPLTRFTVRATASIIVSTWSGCIAGKMGRLTCCSNHIFSAIGHSPK